MGRKALTFSTTSNCIGLVMFTEDDFLPISLLQHLLFCPRRAALVHIEGIWSDNIFTALGQNMHERVHTTEVESRIPAIAQALGSHSCGCWSVIMATTGVLLLGFGGPDSIDAVRPFMCNLMDREPSDELVSKVCMRYLAIGGASPLPLIAAGDRLRP